MNFFRAPFVPSKGRSTAPRDCHVGVILPVETEKVSEFALSVEAVTPLIKIPLAVGSNDVSAQAVRSAYRGVVCWLAKGIGDGLPEVTGRVVRRDIPVRSWEIVDEIYVLRVASS